MIKLRRPSTSGPYEGQVMYAKNEFDTIIKNGEVAADLNFSYMKLVLKIVRELRSNPQ